MRRARFQPVPDPNAGYIDDEDDEEDWNISTHRGDAVDDGDWQSDEEDEEESDMNPNLLMLQQLSNAAAQSQRRPIMPPGTAGGRQSGDAADEFEREMNSELADRMDTLVEKHRHADSKKQTATRGAPTASTSASTSYYEDEYFDSDDEGNKEHGKAKKREVIPDDDLLYDPDLDDEDERWVRNQRRQHHASDQPQAGTTHDPRGRENIAAEPNSDAILSCPACLFILCIDCQQHDIYPSQFRAMFVRNCVVVRSERLWFKPKKGRQGGKGKHASFEPEGQTDDQYNPVKCAECGTVVAMFDSDEVYHFFNVIASEP